MSYSEEDLKKMMRSALKEELTVVTDKAPQFSDEAFDDAVQNSVQEEVKKALANRPPSQPPKPTESHAQHILNCPECYTETVKGLVDMGKTSQYACSSCDLPLGSKEFAEKLVACPRCNSKEAYKKR